MDIEDYTGSPSLLNETYRLNYERLKRTVVEEIEKNRRFTGFLRERFGRNKIKNMIKHPEKNVHEIRALSRYLYIISSHYRRLINYFAQIMLYNYNVVPGEALTRNPSKSKYKKDFMWVVNFGEKYNLKQEAEKMIKICMRDGVAIGIFQEATNSQSAYIVPLEPRYMRIKSIEDGCFIPSIDLSRLNQFNIGDYPSDIQKAYEKYIAEPDKKKRFYEFKNGIAILADDTQPFLWMPPFGNLLLDVADLEDAKALQRQRDEQSNYKVLSAKVDTDDEGEPKMPFSQIQQYYDQMSGELPDGIGLLLSPFTVSDHSFQDNASNDRDAAIAASNSFWNSAGMSSALMGGGNVTTASAMLIAVKPDEAISFSLLKQFERSLNRRIKKKNLNYLFKIKFLYQSIFNSSDVRDSLAKAAQYGLPVKMEYAASLGYTPCETLGNTYLEETILGLATESWVHPLVSSNTQSYSDSEGGRPSESITEISDTGIQTRDSDANENR